MLYKFIFLILTIIIFFILFIPKNYLSTYFSRFIIFFKSSRKKNYCSGPSIYNKKIKDKTLLCIDKKYYLSTYPKSKNQLLSNLAKILSN